MFGAKGKGLMVEVDGISKHFSHSVHDEAGVVEQEYFIFILLRLVNQDLSACLYQAIWLTVGWTRILVLLFFLYWPLNHFKYNFSINNSLHGIF